MTDKDGGVGQSIFQYIVVYDPSAGFVTGGGWINSPSGAYTPDPSLAGRADSACNVDTGTINGSGNYGFMLSAMDGSTPIS